MRVCRIAACEGVQRTSGIRALPASKYSLFTGSSLQPKYTRSPMFWVGIDNILRHRPFSYALPLMRVRSAVLEMALISGRSAPERDQISAEQTESSWQSLFHAEEGRLDAARAERYIWDNLDNAEYTTVEQATLVNAEKEGPCRNSPLSATCLISWRKSWRHR